VSRHRDLDSALAKLAGLSGDPLIDALFDPATTWSEAIRKIWATVGDPSADAGKVLDVLRTHVTHPEIPEGDVVRVMSLHKSKGLTSKVVIVTSCVQGLIPITAPDSAERAVIEREQRRLFYVAMTRATDTLVLSSCRGVERALAYQLGMQVRGFAPKVTFVASQFLSELGSKAPNGCGLGGR
jgi:DNA helicase II / ATP-dependent DNA helicase PcrA